MVIVTGTDSFKLLTTKTKFGFNMGSHLLTICLITEEFSSVRTFLSFESDPKNGIFRIFKVPFDYPVHSPQETVLPQTNGTDGKPRL